MTTSSSKLINSIARRFSTKPFTNNEITPHVHNRNPRNLERLRLDRKPTGYPLDKVKVNYWHRLEIKELKKYAVARLIHHTNKVVVEASTNEWGICKQLPSTLDKMAFVTLAKVFAERCLETGIYSFVCNVPPENEKNLTNVQLFLKLLEDEGLMLKEMSQFDINSIWYVKRERRPWTVLED